MSLIITLFVREGIVMASDSRLTLDNRQQNGPNETITLAVGQSDSNYKTFLLPNDVGISTAGAASINGMPIGGFIESFVSDVVMTKSLEVDEVATELLSYFRALQPPTATEFQVAGYKKAGNTREQQVWSVSVSSNTVTQSNQVGNQGALWNGEADILARLIQPLAQLDAGGQILQKLPEYALPWHFMTLQDAIDFATYAIRTTIESMRFQVRPKTVGGPIDVLLIKPAGSAWIQRKDLRGT